LAGPSLRPIPFTRLTGGAKRKSEQTRSNKELIPHKGDGDLDELPADKPGQHWLDYGGGGEQKEKRLAS